MASRHTFSLRRLLPTVGAIAVLACTLLAAPASATVWGGKLHGATWTADARELDWKWERSEGNVSNCVGPVTYNGTYHFPYGWSCGGVISEINVPLNWYHAGIKNQTSGTLEFSIGYF